PLRPTCPCHLLAHRLVLIIVILSPTPQTAVSLCCDEILIRALHADSERLAAAAAPSPSSWNTFSSLTRTILLSLTSVQTLFPACTKSDHLNISSSFSFFFFLLD